jgi:N-methylhydantoinase A
MTAFSLERDRAEILMTNDPIVVGVDVGGTFTDFVFLADDGTLTVRKRPSTPAQPEQSVLDGLQDAQETELLPSEITLIHGTTVATNALLERRGAKTALLVTAGHRDLLEIARQSRTHLYSLHPQKPLPVLPRADCYEIAERLDWQGSVLVPLDLPAVEALLHQLKRDGYESLAVCLLFAYLNPIHEQQIGDLAHRLGFVVSLSSEIAPEPREYERAVTTAANAFVAPVMRAYLGRLQSGLEAFHTRSFHIMQSNGGTLSAQEAGDFAIQTAVSGPAGGVIAAARIGLQAGFPNLLTFDMGGTSTDVALIRGGVCDMVTLSVVNDMPLRVPMCAIHTVGAGGGSIAWRDAAGGLRVGPRSAGADPGPVAYGKGEQLTVTDANVLLNRLPHNTALAGRLSLDAERVSSSFETFAAHFHLSSIETALGIVEVANAAMARALRHVSVERGVDAAGLTLLSFGGAGGLHACALAERLQIRAILVPTCPGAFSALGLALADTRRDWVQAFAALPCEGDLLPALLPHLAVLEEKKGRSGQGEKQSNVEWFAEVRYRGQSFALTVPMMPDALTAERLAHDFHVAHRSRYGYADTEEPTEIVAVRLVLTTPQDRPVPRPLLPSRQGTPLATLPVHWNRSAVPTALYERQTLAAGQEIPAPAVVLQMDATTLLPPGWLARVDEWGNLLLTRT